MIDARDRFRFRSPRLGRLRRASRVRIAWLLSASAVGIGPASPSSTAWAQTETSAAAADGLAAARALFAEALADEEAGRLRPALDKFVRVSEVRDTAPVEYRIGTCHEGLGQRAPAYDAYGAAIALGEKDPTMADVVQAARGRLEALSKHVARLRLVVQKDLPADAQVAVDAGTVRPESWGQAIALEPGTHTVVATSAGREAFRSQVVLPEGGEASLPVVLATPATADARLDRATPPRASNGTLGWVLLGAGAALVAGAGATLLLRHEDIATLTSACPGGLCPAGSDHGHLESTRDRALAEGPIAAALAAAGLAVAGVGLYFVVSAPGAPPGTVRGATSLDRIPGLGLTGKFW